jgi:hypothetical protein
LTIFQVENFIPKPLNILISGPRGKGFHSINQM